jgi:N12 class adenine-specific DNA methylase
MSGILGFDVGLGKTFTALAVAQHIQSIGVKKKTMFVLPNTVLSNWKREAMRAYDEATMAQCLFVGMTQDRSGEDTVNPALYAADFTRILEGKHPRFSAPWKPLAKSRSRTRPLTPMSGT